MEGFVAVLKGVSQIHFLWLSAVTRGRARGGGPALTSKRTPKDEYDEACRELVKFIADLASKETEQPELSERGMELVVTLWKNFCDKICHAWTVPTGPETETFDIVPEDFWAGLAKGADFPAVPILCWESSQRG